MFLSTALAVKATHNRAGEITYRQLAPLKYEFVLTMYTETGAGHAFNDDAILSFGDGTSDTSQYDVPATAIAPGIEKRTYHFIHSFPGASNYIISFRDENRNNDVKNMSNSIETSFYIETYLVINPLIGYNTSPHLILEPIDFGTVGQLFLHNPNPFDTDGDSLSFKLVPCKQDVGIEVGNYLFPTPENNFASKYFGINPYNGEIRWENPTKPGLYNIAIKIEEWRNGVLIGYIIRDMQIPIKESKNIAPIVDAVKDTCILAGDALEQIIRASDIAQEEGNAGEFDLSASGGPFELNPAANFPLTNGKEEVTQFFRWTPDCDAVRKQPYQVVFKASDKGLVPLVGMTTWQITVIAPAPKNLQASAQGSTVVLKWDFPTFCSGKAVGYKIYRRNGSLNFQPDACETGVPARLGYRLIKTIKKLNTTEFIDDNNGKGLAPGGNYCYRIVMYFLDKAESYASNEACIALKKDIPVITHVNVLQTSTTNGSLYIDWSKPNGKDLDTNFFGGFYPPYTYQLYRAVHSPNISPKASDFVMIHQSKSNSFYQFNDTTYTDNAVGLNTQDKQFTYKVAFRANYGDKQVTDTLVGTTQLASSPYISLSPGDNKVSINWTDAVPWSNKAYLIYRSTPGNPAVLIGSSDTAAYVDRNLVNGKTYCYTIETIGSYPAPGFVDPIKNKSQESCSTPIDNEAPCAPQLVAIGNCETFTDSLRWVLESNDCLSEIVSYEIYRSSFTNSEPQLIATINDRNAFKYVLIDQINSIAGCFSVVAVDSVQLRSSSNVVCIDNCPEFILPNVFTPNDDGINDYFKPFAGDSSRFNQDIRFYVYDRWGNLVFETTDKDINWDGTHFKSHQKLPAGTYYYVCFVNEIKVEGIIPRPIKGFITILPD